LSTCTLPPTSYVEIVNSFGVRQPDDLFGDEGALHRMRIVDCAEACESVDAVVCAKLRQRRDAGTERLAVDVDDACSALPKAAAKARVQMDVCKIASGVYQYTAINDYHLILLHQ
jgi:hypothetical protein